MNKADVILLVQLLQTMKELSVKMSQVYAKKEVENLAALKKEIIELCRKVDKRL